MNQLTRITTLAVLGLLLANGALAQTTNITRTITVQLTANVQTTDTTVKSIRITNKDLLNAIAVDTASNVTVTARSKLLIRVPVGSSSDTNFAFYILVRTGTNDFDVTPFFKENQIGELVTKIAGIAETEFSIQEIIFTSGSLSFDVQGYTTSTVVNVKDPKGHFIDTSSLDVNAVAGTGTVGGSTAVFNGKITVNGIKVEITP